jgi:hypothetical protein
MPIDLAELNAIAARAIEGEYALYLFVYPDSKVRVTLEKGSSYGGGFHMKIDAQGDTPSEAFENALRQFPASPVGVPWDTRRLTGPVEEAVFTTITDEPI